MLRARVIPTVVAMLVLSAACNPLVSASKPALTADIPPSAGTDTTQPATGIAYLSDLTALPGGDLYTSGAASVNGILYVHSVSLPLSVAGLASRTVEYDLGRSWHKLLLWEGVSDDSPANVSVKFEILADGVPVTGSANFGGVGTAQVGTDVPVFLDVTNVLRLTLRTTLTTPSDRDITAVWADAQLRQTCPPADTPGGPCH
jgi:hypothetical protein